MSARFLKGTVVLLVILLLQSCFSFYEVNYTFNKNFESGKLEAALSVLESSKMKKKERVQLLYYMNAGAVSSILGDYDKSNEKLEQAYLLAEDYRTNYLNEGLALLTNPTMVTYKGEDHELLYIHYYKALNFIKQNNLEAAMVECRRMQIKLNALKDKYKDKNNKFSKDAFMHVLMGLIYDAFGDYNNAFISYRNAHEVYESFYGPEFGLYTPLQVKKDLLRTAYLTGFYDEVRQYEKKFSMTYEHEPIGDKGQVVFLWNNGLSPVKDEWSINFTIVRGTGGVVTFVNDDLGLNFPFPYDKNESDDGGDPLSDLEFIRIAFPKYEERPLIYSGADIIVKDKRYELERAESINDIAKLSLQQRMLKELGKTLLRVALKKASEYSLRKENEDLGALLGAVNALTEKADTRNWQTLPHSIYYTRVVLPEGKHEAKLSAKSKDGNIAARKETPLQFDVQSNFTHFYSHYSLESRQKSSYLYY